jgi:hypothetical protein
MKKLNRSTGLRARAPLAMAVAFALLSAPAAQAFEFERGELTGSIDTTVSLGYSWRTEDQDPNLIGKSHFNPSICLQNIGLAPFPAPTATVPVPQCSTGFSGSASQQAALGRFSVNRDDGNLLYDQGDAISQAFKITSEMDLKYKNYGAFVRASYFYDMENANRKDLTAAAKEKVGKDFRLLDAFIYGSFDIGDHKLNARVGRQVISWGESTFVQGGINVINPIDVSKLRVAGAELKEAFLPVDAVWASFGITDNLSVEGFYLTEFEQTEADPAGTYFSQNDFATNGGTYVMLGFGIAPQPVNNPERFASTCITGGATGFLNSDRFTELTQFYTQNPGLIAPAFGTSATSAAAFAIRFGCGNAVPRGPDVNARDSGQFGFAARYFSEALNQTDFAFYAMNYHSRLPLLSGYAANLSRVLTGVSPGNSTSFFVEYPEDIQLYGMSFNTTLPGGIAWQGEISYRPNQPLQVDDVELLFAALTPLNIPAIIPPTVPNGARFFSQLGSFGSGQLVKGWREKEVSQLQMTFTKAIGQALGADQIALVGEVGATQVWDMEDPSVLRYEGEGTDTGGGCNALGAIAAAGTGGLNTFGCLRNPATTTKGFPTPFSWGYRLAARADYNSFAGTPITLSPRLAFSHDVSGISPGPGGNFLEGRKTLTVGAEANYLNKVVFDLSWTRFYGAGGLNQISDRDFASFSVKYSF